MSTVFTIAHLSDVHLSPLTGFTPRHWNTKRALGFINWQRKRRHIHRRDIADRIVADIKERAPGHIALTGDLINIGLPAEYDAATAWLQSVGTPAEVSLVPGNHDIYTRLGRDPGVGRWAAYMTSDAWARELFGSVGSGFPYVRRVGPIAIVGLCSAVETAPGIATGRLGPEQIAAAARILERLAAEPVFRLVMIHHPPLPGQTRPRHELTDAQALADVLSKAGADLVLHGHTHLATATSVLRGNMPVHVIGVGSASASRGHGAEPPAQYNLLRISGSPRAWTVELTRRGLRPGSEGLVDLETSILA
jgi:3',5'-cyclic AMP phosphodiesterase CpdA